MGRKPDSGLRKYKQNLLGRLGIGLFQLSQPLSLTNRPEQSKWGFESMFEPTIQNQYNEERHSVCCLSFINMFSYLFPVFFFSQFNNTEMNKAR